MNLNPILILLKEKAWLLVLAVGAIFVAVAQYSVSGKIGELVIAQLVVPSPYLYYLGLGMILVGLAMAVIPLLPNKNKSGILSVDQVVAIRELPHGGFEATLMKTRILIEFGQLQAVAKSAPKSAVVLPMNDLFEDACFSDKSTSIGSFVTHHFTPAQIESLKGRKSQALEHWPSATLSTSSGNAMDSFGVGKCIVLEEGGYCLLIASGATRRENEGVKTEISFIYELVRSALTSVADHNLNTVYLPLLGAGRGGLPAKVALISLLNAICECAHRPAGHNFGEVHVVIFKKDNDAPVLGAEEIKSVLGLVLSAWIH